MNRKLSNTRWTQESKNCKQSLRQQLIVLNNCKEVVVLVPVLEKDQLVEVLSVPVVAIVVKTPEHPVATNETPVRPNTAPHQDPFRTTWKTLVRTLTIETPTKIVQTAATDTCLQTTSLHTCATPQETPQTQECHQIREFSQTIGSQATIVTHKLTEFHQIVQDWLDQIGFHLVVDPGQGMIWMVGESHQLIPMQPDMTWMEDVFLQQILQRIMYRVEFMGIKASLQLDKGLT